LSRRNRGYSDLISLFFLLFFTFNFRDVLVLIFLSPARRGSDFQTFLESASLARLALNRPIALKFVHFSPSQLYYLFGPFAFLFNPTKRFATACWRAAVQDLIFLDVLDPWSFAWDWGV